MSLRVASQEDGGPLDDEVVLVVRMARGRDGVLGDAVVGDLRVVARRVGPVLDVLKTTVGQQHVVVAFGELTVAGLRVSEVAAGLLVSDLVAELVTGRVLAVVVLTLEQYTRKYKGVD